MPTVTKRISGSTTIGSTASMGESGLAELYDLTKAFLSFSVQVPSSVGFMEVAVISGKLYNNAGQTWAQFERASAGVYLDAFINWTVVELTDTIVQSGTVSMAGGVSSITDAISSVNTAKTFIIATGRIANANTTPDCFLFTAEVTNGTTLTFQRGTGTGVLTIEWQAITIDDITSLQVRNGTITSAGLALTPVTFTAINMAKTIIVPYYRTTSSGFVARNFRTARLVNQTELTFGAPNNITTNQIDYSIAIIQFAGGRVSRAYSSFPSAVTSQGATIPNTIDLNISLARFLGFQGTWNESTGTSNNPGDSCMRISALTSTQLTATRGRTGTTGYFPFEVIEFGVASTNKKWEHYRKQFTRQ